MPLAEFHAVSKSSTGPIPAYNKEKEARFEVTFEIRDPGLDLDPSSTVSYEKHVCLRRRRSRKRLMKRKISFVSYSALAYVSCLGY